MEKEKVDREELLQEIKEYVYGEKIVLDRDKFEEDLINRCDQAGIDYEFEKAQFEKEQPKKRSISQIIQDNEKGFDNGLRIAFNSLIRGKGLATRYLNSSSDKNNFQNFHQNSQNLLVDFVMIMQEIKEVSIEFI